MTPETSPDSPDHRRHYGARSALRTLLEENFSRTERTPTDARNYWEEITGTKLSSKHMCVAIKSQFDKGNLARATELKLGFTYVTGNAWKKRFPN